MLTPEDKALLKELGGTRWLLERLAEERARREKG